MDSIVDGSTGTVQISRGSYTRRDGEPDGGKLLPHLIHNFTLRSRFC